MKPIMIVGIVLAVLGVFVLVSQGITYTKTEKGYSTSDRLRRQQSDRRRFRFPRCLEELFSPPVSFVLLRAPNVRNVGPCHR
jgi:hypothetical protein